ASAVDQNEVRSDQSGRGETSWVGSLQPAVTFTVGPLASALTNRYGCRVVTMVGAAICAAGFVLSVFTPNLYFLYFSSGILAGLGFGLIYLPAIVSVAQYFEKRRSFATGLAVCGSGFGTFAIAPFSEFLLQQYGWRGAMLILGGVILNVVACGAVFRPLEAVETRQGEKDEEKGSGQGDVSKGDVTNPPEAEALLNRREANGNAPKPKESNGQGQHSPNGGSGDASTLPKRNAELQKTLLSNSPHHLPLPSNGSPAHFAKSDGALHRMKKTPSDGVARLLRERQFSMSGGSTSPSARPVGRKDVFYSGSLLNIPMFRSHHDLYITSITSIPDALEDQESETPTCFGFAVPLEFTEAFRQMMSLSLLKNPVFLMFAISNFFTSIGFNMPFIFLPDRAKLAGIDEVKAAWLLSTIGIANTLGRVVFGFMADLRWVNRLMLYNTALTICGVATALSPFVGGSYELLITYAAVFGIFIGVYVSLTSVVLVDLLGIDKLTNSFGLLLLFQGAATFIGPPLAGWMCDWTGSYDISFNVMGALIAVSGAMLYLLPFVQRRYERSVPPEEIVHQIEMGKQTIDHEILREAERELVMRPRKTSF
ncbi:hypothetical protein BaRGS_00024475, partial [Batillaria attramentaria]